MHLLTVLLYTVVAVTPTLTQDDTWALPTPDITAWASEGIISLFPFTTTGPAPTLATPTGVADPHPASSCTAQPWKLHGVNSFHADPDNEVINYSHVEFYFNDTNANLESYCTHDFPANSGEGPFDTKNWYPCYNYGMSFLYAGSIMGLRRHFECGGQTITAQGQAPLGLECYRVTNGTDCATIRDVEVPVTIVMD